MQTTTILLSGTALIASFSIGYGIAKSRWIGMWEIADAELTKLLRNRGETDKAAANIKVERDHFKKQVTQVSDQRDAAEASLKLAVRQRDDARQSRDEFKANAESERNRANSLQQELTAERAKPKAAPIAETLKHGEKSQRQTLKPKFSLDLAPPPAPAPDVSSLETRIRKLVSGLPEIESEKLANSLSTKDLRGNRLRVEIKPIMSKLGFELVRGVSRPGKRAKVRMWRRKK